MNKKRDERSARIQGPRHTGPCRFGGFCSEGDQMPLEDLSREVT